jgi:hypothetical protein
MPVKKSVRTNSLSDSLSFFSEDIKYAISIYTPNLHVMFHTLMNKPSGGAIMNTLTVNSGMIASIDAKIPEYFPISHDTEAMGSMYSMISDMVESNR